MMASKCNKFLPNIFNKTKCQHCFAAKELHSAQALENNKASRKVSKCGYLFVSPGFDFNNPLDRSRRWQRRFFILYDDGELSYSVDENPDTVPQCTIDMNKCTEVRDAEASTTHANSLAVITPEKTIHIKANSKEEIQWWQDILAEFPKALKATKPRRKAPNLILSNKENQQPRSDTGDGFVLGKTPSYNTFRGVRSLKHKYDANHQEGMRKSSSLHDLSTEEQESRDRLKSSRFLSHSGDRLDIFSREPSRTDVGLAKIWPSKAQPSLPLALTPSKESKQQAASSSNSSMSSVGIPRRASLEDHPIPPTQRTRVTRDRSSSLKDYASQLTVKRESMTSGEDFSLPSTSADETDSNETDELKDLVYMKKGWLIKQNTSEKELKKHWFVLAGNSLRYYQDAKAEEANSLDGRIDLSTCYEVSDVATHRNYGFKVKTKNGEYILAAMTSGIRNNWMKAIRLCMELHSSVNKRSSSASLSPSPFSLRSSPQTAMDDLDFKFGVSTSTAAIKGAGGETSFQLVGRRERDSYRRDVQRPTRRHHSDVNPGNVGKALSIKEFSTSIDIESPTISGRRSTGSYLDGSKIQSAERSRGGSAPVIKRYVEGSDGSTSSPGSVGSQGAEIASTKRSVIASESTLENVKKDLMRRAKSPSARVKEKTRTVKPRLHSPVTLDEGFGYHGSHGLSIPDPGSSISDPLEDPHASDIAMSEEEFETTIDRDDVGSTTQSEVTGQDEALVEILETEVESLKDRLESTQTELDKVSKDNMDLKTRLHKDAQSIDSGYSGTSSRWGQTTSANQTDHGLKRQLKESRDTVTRQRLDIESLKSKLDMSVSKLTGTEKALSEALKDYKQEKDKFLKMSSEWNRRIRTMEGQAKDSQHKLDRSRETLQIKERECRRMEADVKNNQSKVREQEREILKLKAVEHEYKQLKEKLDDKENDLAGMRSALKEKDDLIKKTKEEYERQLEDMDREYGDERDDLEHHMEQLKSELYSAHDRHSNMADNMTSDMADMFKEKDDVISQLEEKMIETDKRLVEMSEELHAEMGENAEMAHTLEVLQEDKKKLISTLSQLESQLMSVRNKVSGFESENSSLKNRLEEVCQENKQLQHSLNNLQKSCKDGAPIDQQERLRLHNTIDKLNTQISTLQGQLDRSEPMLDRGNSSVSSTGSDHQADLLHTILLTDSGLKEVNTMLLTLRQNFDSYLNSISDQDHRQAIGLADLIEDVGHKCQDIQSSLTSRDILSPKCEEKKYEHIVSVSALSGGKAIMEEYKELKVKFDSAVFELKGLKSELNKPTRNVKNDKELEEKVITLETSYGQKIESLIARVDSLSGRINAHPQSISSKVSPLSDIGKQIQVVENSLSVLEKQAINQKDSNIDDNSLALKLEPIRLSLEDASKLLNSFGESLNISISDLNPRLESCKDRLGTLFKTLKSSKSLESSEDVPKYSDAANSGFNVCLLEIKEKVQEVAEMLDSLEEDGEDSDSEDQEDEEESMVENIREKLASLTEYVEQHSKLTSSDWELTKLMNLQKDIILDSNKAQNDSKSISDEDQLNLYANRLSLEAVILSEMGYILQNRDQLIPQDSVSRQIDLLSSQLLTLQQLLDSEMKTMHFDDPQADLLKSYAELISEKILVNTQLNSLLEPNPQVSVSSDTSFQPVLLATEAILRSQVDTCVATNMDHSIEELMIIPTYLTSRSLIQGEITNALSCLKDRLHQSQEVLKPGLSCYQIMMDRVLGRQNKVMSSVEAYEKQIVHSLAVIIFKESKEMTIIEGPESILEAMCSELSTIIETYIQRYKEKCRAAMDTHSAHKYDVIVNELRCVRETMLVQIKNLHEEYAQDPGSARDSSLDIPVQSLDDTINNFGEILSLKAIINGTSHFLSELLKMGSSVLADLVLEPDVNEDNQNAGIEKCLNSFVLALSQGLQAEAVSKELKSRRVINSSGEQDSDNHENIVLTFPDLSNMSDKLGCSSTTLMREAVFNAQLIFTLFKQKLLFSREISQLKARRPTRVKPDLNPEESHDSDDTLDLQTDFQALLSPLEDVVESKYEDELEVLQVLLGLTSQLKATVGEGKVALEDQVCQLEQKVHHELEMAKQRHDTHLEVFKQESNKLEKMFEEQALDRDHYEERCSQLEEELTSVSMQHEEEKERVKKDILTAVHAIRNDEKSDTQEVSRLSKELEKQKLNFRKTLGSLKKECHLKEKQALIQSIEEQMSSININEDEELEDDQPPLPSQAPPEVQSHLPEQQEEDGEPSKLDLSHHEQEVELLRKEKEEALAEEMRNTKAALDAMRKAYEEELGQEKAKYKEALVTMYTEEYVTEIKLRHQEDNEKLSDELQKLSMHYSGKCEDYKLLEMKLGQTKSEYESHIQQLASSNNQLEEMLNKEIEEMKEFIKNKPSIQSMTTGSATIEEELYDAKIMFRVKDAELQKLRNQVKNLENSLSRTTEEQRQTMTQYMQSLKTSGEMKKQFQEEITQLTDKLNKVLGSQGLKANIRRTPSFHQRARSPSPSASTQSPRKENTDHSSRDSHRKRHIQPKDLRRSKSSPSLPYVFDGKAPPGKASTVKSNRRSRSPKI